MSSILSAQNLQTLRRRNSPRRCPILPSAFLSSPRPRPPPGPLDRPRPIGDMCLRLRLDAVEIVAVFLIVLLRSFARLPLRRQAARHAAADRFGLALRARPFGLDLIRVDANDQVTE